ncbi:hypothetical protein WJX72_006377 [[Myrmecia] bisecta]|uniref:HTH TFE/IIEalpha-type domain-containing protein n=1 Tax=[Myrmecia] bisecta TaxID=41462 RepID=A0AAW1P2R6_9CHLO
MSVTVPASFKTLVKLVAKAFYSGDVPPRDPNEPPPTTAKAKQQAEYKGLAIVVLNALLNREWTSEDDLARDLKLHPKQLRKTLRYLEQDHILQREHIKKARTRKQDDGTDGTAGEVVEDEDDINPRVQLNSFCSIDYPALLDMVQLRLHLMHKYLKDSVQDQDPIQEYLCPTPDCGSRYTTLQAPFLIDLTDGLFHCERCGAVLQAALGRGGEVGDEASRRQRRADLKNLQARMDAQLKPLTDQVARVKDMRIPDFGSLKDWAADNKAREARAANGGRGGGGGAGRANGLQGIDDEYRETQVEVDMGGGASSAQPSAAPKEIPRWLWREGMNVPKPGTAEAAAADAKEDAKQADGTAADVQEAYVTAWMEAVRRQQEALGGATTDVMPEQKEDVEGPARKRIKTESGAEAAGPAIKAEVKPEPSFPEEEPEWEDAAHPAGQPAAAAGQTAAQEPEWEDAAPQAGQEEPEWEDAGPSQAHDDGEDDLQWEDT